MNASKKRPGLITVIALSSTGACLFLVQIIGQFGLFNFTPDSLRPRIIQQGLEKAMHSPLFLVEFCWYLLLGTLVHALLLLVPIIVVRDIGRHRGLSRRRRLAWTLVATSLFCVLLLMWNNALFAFSDIVPDLYLVSVAPLALLSLGFIGVFAAWLLSRPARSTMLAAVSITVFLFLPSLVPTIPSASAMPHQPNVILIGIDSLRPDHLTSASESDPSLMPHLQQWLSQAVVYDDAVTPMARTFPALTSLLTAKYPRNNGARINLTPESRIELGWTLGKYLQHKGYSTAFAIDDARFANLSRNYGFDTLSVPQIGLPDFIFGDLIDSVGTNLLNLFPVADWLNPAQYGNRAAVGAYRPTQFANNLSRLVSKVPNASSFLMVHFTLPHLPYVRRGIFSRPLRSPLPFKSYEPYERGLIATDGQFAHYLNALKQHGMLQDAVVVVYSDHGEEFSIAKDNEFRHDQNLIAGRFGHGSSIFSPAQSRILLAMQSYRNGKPQLSADRSHKPALLTDIAPTVLHQIESSPSLPGNLDGINLADEIPVDRIRYLESSALMPKIANGEVNRAKLLKRFGNGFRVTDDLTLRTRESLADPRLKQRGAIIGNRVVGINATAADDITDYNAPWHTVKWPSPETTPGTDTSLVAQKALISRFFDLPRPRR